MKPHDKPQRTRRDPVASWNTVLKLVAEDDAETIKPTVDDAQWAAELDAMVTSQLKHLRRQLTPVNVPIQRDVQIPPEIAAMGRAALVKQLEILRLQSKVNYAFQDLRGMSDGDLQTMLVLLMASQER